MNNAKPSVQEACDLFHAYSVASISFGSHDKPSIFDLSSATMLALDAYDEDMTPEMFEALVLPSLAGEPITAPGVKSVFITDTLISLSLRHPACPAFVLEQVCFSKRTDYASIAARSDNCPEEARVYVALQKQMGE